MKKNFAHAGHVMAINALAVDENRNAYLVSPHETLHEEHCLSFYYWMRGLEFGTFR